MEMGARETVSKTVRWYQSQRRRSSACYAHLQLGSLQGQHWRGKGTAWGYGIATNERTVCVSWSDPATATTTVQEAWQLAKKRGNIRCRLHDLRHTAITRMLEAGIPLTVVGSIFGWSGSTMVLMAKRYGHIGAEAKREALAVLDRSQTQRRATAPVEALVEEATKPAAPNVLQQQAGFDTFVARYNQERPHQALGMKVPAELYAPSARVYRGLEDLTYPFHDATFTVTHCGRICFHGRKINLSHVLAGQNVGVTQVGDHLWLVTFMHYDLGYFDDEACRLEPIENPFGPKVLPMCSV
jgi:hypothetical protein